MARMGTDLEEMMELDWSNPKSTKHRENHDLVADPFKHK